MVIVKQPKNNEPPQRVRLQPAEWIALVALFWAPLGWAFNTISGHSERLAVLSTIIEQHEKRLDVAGVRHAAASSATQGETIQHFVGAVSP